MPFLSDECRAPPFYPRPPGRRLFTPPNPEVIGKDNPGPKKGLEEERRGTSYGKRGPPKGGPRLFKKEARPPGGTQNPIPTGGEDFFPPSQAEETGRLFFPKGGSRWKLFPPPDNQGEILVKKGQSNFKSSFCTLNPPLGQEPAPDFRQKTPRFLRPPIPGPKTNSSHPLKPPTRGMRFVPLCFSVPEGHPGPFPNGDPLGYLVPSPRD